jgi:hypothetical protein
LAPLPIEGTVPASALQVPCLPHLGLFSMAAWPGLLCTAEAGFLAPFKRLSHLVSGNSDMAQDFVPSLWNRHVLSLGQDQGPSRPHTTWRSGVSHGGPLRLHSSDTCWGRLPQCPRPSPSRPQVGLLPTVAPGPPAGQGYYVEMS